MLTTDPYVSDVAQEADSKLASQIRSLDESKKEVTRLTDALLQKS